MSAATSAGLVKDRVNEAPSLTGPLLPNVAVGATLLMVTEAVYSVSPPSLSLILPFTDGVPLSVVEQLAVLVLL